MNCSVRTWLCSMAAWYSDIMPCHVVNYLPQTQEGLGCVSCLIVFMNITVQSERGVSRYVCSHILVILAI